MEQQPEFESILEAYPVRLANFEGPRLSQAGVRSWTLAFTVDPRDPAPEVFIHEVSS